MDKLVREAVADDVPFRALNVDDDEQPMVLFGLLYLYAGCVIECENAGVVAFIVWLCP
jgi:hypothetical protein